MATPLIDRLKAQAALDHPSPVWIDHREVEQFAAEIERLTISSLHRATLVDAIRREEMSVMGQKVRIAHLACTECCSRLLDADIETMRISACCARRNMQPVLDEEGEPIADPGAGLPVRPVDPPRALNPLRLIRRRMPP